MPFWVKAPVLTSELATEAAASLVAVNPAPEVRMPLPVIDPFPREIALLVIE